MGSNRTRRATWIEGCRRYLRCEPGSKMNLSKGGRDALCSPGIAESNRRTNVRILTTLAVVVSLLSASVAEARTHPAASRASAASDGYLFDDSHLHLTNYIQQGTDIRKYMEIMGDKVGRSTLFGIPLQQTWSYANSGDYTPTYYLQSDAPLYYYSFTDAFIAMSYLSLPPQDRARLDPMITGFNPADMYGVDHIKRVLTLFPGVFSGIGEFSIHKEFASSKVAGGAASLTNPALDRILDFAAEAGLVVIFHNDIDVPFAKANAEPVYLTQMKELLRRHPKTTTSPHRIRPRSYANSISGTRSSPS
jgi:hypothetical protein